MSKQGCWNNLYSYRLPTAYLYRYTFDLYQYRLPTTYLYRYSSTCTGTPLTCTGTGYPLHTCTGTPLTCTSTGYPLHTCTGTAQPVPVHPTGFCPKMCGILHFHTFFIHNSSPIHPIPKIHHGIYPKTTPNVV